MYWCKSAVKRKKGCHAEARSNVSLSSRISACVRRTPPTEKAIITKSAVSLRPSKTMRTKAFKRYVMGSLPNTCGQRSLRTTFERLRVTPLLFGLLLVTGITACRPEIKKANFFDLAGYFTNEAARLKANNRPVFKTVEHNGVSESKKLTIRDWDAELSLFKNSDINKPAWSSSYEIHRDSGLTIYVAKSSDLRTQRLMIKQDNRKVKWILIYNHTPKNPLYDSFEKLTYVPDSLYMIEKRQSVRVLGINRYRIKGLFNQ